MFEELKPHLVELRKRLGYAVLAIFLAFIGSYYFWQLILDWMTMPLYAVIDTKLVYTGPLDSFFISLKVSFFAGFIVALPVVFWQLWLFIAPGLYEHEKKFVIPFVLFTTIMFLGGASFCYFMVLPLGLDFLMNFGKEVFTALPRANEYVTFFTKIMIAFGIAFEMPVLTFFLAKIGLITDKTLKSSFQYSIVIIFLFSALLTPPDIISHFMMAGPLIVLYGFSILIAKAVNPAPKEEEDEEEVQNET